MLYEDYGFIFDYLFKFYLSEDKIRRLSQGSLNIDKQTNALTDYNQPYSVGGIRENAPKYNVQNFHMELQWL